MNARVDIVDVKAFMDEMGLDGSLAEELYKVFVDELRQETDKLTECILKADQKSYAAIIHNIKGIAGSYKANKLHHMATDIDATVKSMDLTGAFNQVFDLRSAIKETIDEIKRHFWWGEQ
jgi:HPt (histidine-containing phosphotransfer) domain-containing protein